MRKKIKYLRDRINFLTEEFEVEIKELVVPTLSEIFEKIFEREELIDPHQFEKQACDPSFLSKYIKNINDYYPRDKKSIDPFKTGKKKMPDALFINKRKSSDRIVVEAKRVAVLTKKHIDQAKDYKRYGFAKQVFIVVLKDYTKITNKAKKEAERHGMKIIEMGDKDFSN